MSYNGKVTNHEIKNFAQSLLLETLGFVSLTVFTPVKLLLDMLLLAAVSRTSIEQATKNSKFFPSSKTLRNHIRQQLPSIDDVEIRLNNSLQATLSKNLAKKPLPIAIDLVEIPYYGKGSIHSDSIRRTPRKNGTSRCHAYATACSIYKGKRYTLAVTYVRYGEKMHEVLMRLESQLKKVRIKILYLLLDRGFYSVEAIRWMKRKRISFIMPAKIGSKALNNHQKVKSSGVFEYELVSPKSGKVSVEMVRYCFNPPKGSKKKGEGPIFMQHMGFQGKRRFG